MNTGSFKNVTNKLFFSNNMHTYLYKPDVVLNNVQTLICHKIQPTTNQPNHMCPYVRIYQYLRTDRIGHMVNV